ncbi:MAG: GAF domain-containing protein, partial [Chloroflexi bacterium]
MSNPTQALVKQLEARIKALTQTNQQLQSQLNRISLLHEVSIELSTALHFETIVTKSVGFARHLGATSGEIHLITDTGDVYFKSTFPERNNLNDLERQELVRRVLSDGLDAWVLQTGQLALVLDTTKDDRWLPIEYSDQTISVRSAICAPIKLSQGQLKGAISFVHPEPNFFSSSDLNLLGTLTTHIVTALENAYHVADVEDSLREAHLMLDISRQFAGISTHQNVHRALLQSVAATGANNCTLFLCHGLSSNNLPTHASVSFAGNTTEPNQTSKLVNFRFALREYPALMEMVSNQETLVIENIDPDERISEPEKSLFHQLNAQSMVINPLVTRIHVIGFLAIAFETEHHFTERDLALYRTLCNQTTLAIEHVQQIERTESALAETQTLYRAGRVLAAAADQTAILQEALVEFVYSLGLDQGSIILLTPDRKFGELHVYLEEGELQEIEPFKFPIDEKVFYQQTLLAGQPFFSNDFANDDRIINFSPFNSKRAIKSILQAPLIFNGETIGWIGADAVNQHRDFTQSEVDLARAMADQIIIAIQNRRLLEQSERRAEQLQAVATVGQAVTGQVDLDEVLKLTVNLIRNRFGFYHVSVFLIDDSREWAVVKASTGDVGKIMVTRPHRLGVGSNSIVGYVTKNAKPRIALDVGADAVHFNNPLLPNTRSEMALPLIARGVTIGALDVQSVEANAFSNEDVETLQIMADQVTTAIETARLFEQTRRRLDEQAMLYRIGTRVSGTLNLQETTDILVSETADMLNVAEVALSLFEDDNTAHTISDYIKPGAPFPSYQGARFNIDKLSTLPQLISTKQEVVIYANDAAVSGWEKEYLEQHHGSAMLLVPILLRNQLIGMLEIYDNTPGRRFSKEDISLLDSVALQAANAIETARLFGAARESELFLKSIINQIPDPIFIKDTAHRWTVINNAFAQDILGKSEAEILGKTDFDYFSPERANTFWEQDKQVFNTGQPFENEDSFTDAHGRQIIRYVRKIPLYLSPTAAKPDHLIGIIQDITERKQTEKEHQRLIEDTSRTLARTQTLYRISDALATSADLQNTFEQVLYHYLNLLGLSQGSIMLYNKAANSCVTRARMIGGKAVEPTLVLPVEEDLVFQHMRKEMRPLVIVNPAENPLIKKDANTRGQQNATGMLFIPLIQRNHLEGLIIADATDPEHSFKREDIETGEAIADQLAIWLENRRLLEEAQYRWKSLQTTAEVSRAASSILNIDELIETSVNMIRDRYNFYYVGLFLVDSANEYAVLKAGTGEAGKIQLEKQHKLKIGGESMIGWSVANRKARIALDVGEEAVHFKNPILPDTRSEMALPLISREGVLGALTVQSTQRLAFSDEDITLLQTMADQLANAIKNAELFTQSQTALSEAESLYQITQALSSAGDEETVCQLAADVFAQNQADSAV